MGLAGAGGIGFALGAHFAPGSAALRSALKSVRNQNHHLEGQILDLQNAAPTAGGAVTGGGADFAAIGEILAGGDWKALIPIVLKNPGLIKVGLEAIQGKIGQDPSQKPAAPAGQAPAGATQI